MKILLILITTLLTISFYLSTRSSAQRFDPLGEKVKRTAGWRPKSIRIYFESYELTAVQFAEIMSASNNTTNQTELRNRLFQQCKEGKIKLVSNNSVVARPSERSVTESVLELIYPTEGDPPEGGVYNHPGRPMKADQFKVDPKKTYNPIFPPNPTAFQTRNVGTTIEVEPGLGEDGITVEMKIKPEIVEYVGERIHSTWDTGFAQSTPSTPKFYTCRTDTSVTVLSGEFLHYATYTPHLNGKPDKTRKIINFVKADVLTSQ